MDRVLQYFIVEDKRIDEIHLIDIISKFPYLQLGKTASNIFDAITLIEKCEPKIVFMDIEIQGGTGFELLKVLKKKMPILVFVTAHPEFVLQGYEASALDYLLKPITEERFRITYDRIMEYAALKRAAEMQLDYAGPDIIFIKEGYTKIALDTAEILYLEAMQDYTKVITAKRKYMVHVTLSQFLNDQTAGVFIRIHRSYAVAAKSIKELYYDKVVCDGLTLPIGKTYRVEMSKFKL